MPAEALEWKLSTADLVNDQYDKKVITKDSFFKLADYYCSVSRERKLKKGDYFERDLYCTKNGVMMSVSLTCKDYGGEFIELSLYNDELTRKNARLILACSST